MIHFLRFTLSINDLKAKKQKQKKHQLYKKQKLIENIF